MEKKEKTKVKKASVLLGFVAGIVAILVIMANTNVITEKPYEKSWHELVAIYPNTPLGEATPAAGASGILEVYFLNYTAAASIAENTSATIEGWCDANDLGYAWADDNETDLAHSTAFTIVVRVRGNATHCKRGATWYDTDLRVRITCTSLGIAADTVMNSTVSANNTNYDFLYMNFWDYGASGHTLTKDQTVEITAIKFEAYF